MSYFQSIPTYIINLKKRIDRKDHILKEFRGRNEFAVTMVEAVEHEIGAVGLWNSLVQIVTNLPNDEPDFVIICEDDHQFTKDYSPAYLFECIDKSRNLDADILTGGPSWFDNAMQLSDNLYWMENFTGLQFTIIFKKFFSSILSATFLHNEVADRKISRLSNTKMLIYPFISTQKDFGYSDVTEKNEETGKIDLLFSNSSEKIRLINKVIEHYGSIPAKTGQLIPEMYDQIKIPTYVINLSERTDRLAHIKKEFQGKDEFEVTVIEACRHPIGAIGLWQSIRKIITLAIENNDDVIIICEDDHQFTEFYSRASLIRNIMEAHYQGADILSGGIGRFSQIIQLTEERFWIDSFWSTQFIILYRKSFDLILSEEFDDTVAADDLLSKITSNKMVIFPFISLQKDFAYSDISEINVVARDIQGRFEWCSNRIKEVIRIRKKYGLTPT